jgi:hypothetical protein
MMKKRTFIIKVIEKNGSIGEEKIVSYDLNEIVYTVPCQL